MSNTATRIAIMRGPIAEVGFAQLLQVVGLSRQYTAIEIRGSESLIGAIFVKAGRVLRVQPELPDGRTNFMRLFREAPSRDFEVYRLSEEGAFPAPLGTVEEMLYEAIVSIPDPQDASMEDELSTALRPSAVQAITEPPLDDELELMPWPARDDASEPYPYDTKAPSIENPWVATDRSVPSEPLSGEEELQMGAWPSMARSTDRAPTVVPMPAKQPRAPRLAPKDTAKKPQKPEHDALSASLRRLRARQVAHERVPHQREHASKTRAESPIPGLSEHEKTSPQQPSTAASPIVAVASTKGGVGKTTITLNLGVATARRGISTVLVDLDPNSDLVAALKAESRVSRGLYDLLQGYEGPVLRQTAQDTLQILPARGYETPLSALSAEIDPQRLADIFNGLQQQSDLILVDCPSGVFGPSQYAIQQATHVIGVLQAEPLASRSMKLLRDVLNTMDSTALLGVVVNMLTPELRESAASLSMLSHGADRPFALNLPRSDAFVRASMAGYPIGYNAGFDQLAWLFGGLAEEALERLALIEPRQASEVQSFLL
ncbi:MAG: ParA family protein [Myxococcota bacterium]